MRLAAGIQFAVGQRFVLEMKRDIFRMLLRLFLEKLVEGFHSEEIRCRWR